MTQARKIRYEIDLTSRQASVPSSSPNTRPLTHDDRDTLSQLILDAYLDTIDYEGETLVEAQEAIDEWLDESPLLTASFAAVDGDSMVSATLLQMLNGHPFIRGVMTKPSHKKKGYGTAAVEATLNALQTDDHTKVVFYITEGNTPSETLFNNLGAQPIPREL